MHRDHPSPPTPPSASPRADARSLHPALKLAGLLCLAPLVALPSGSGELLAISLAGLPLGLLIRHVAMAFPSVRRTVNSEATVRK